MIRTVIVEDEPLALDRLRACLAFQDDVEVVGDAADGLAAVSVLDEMQPALLFLDVRLPAFSGFEVLRRVARKPSVIFTTAHDEYAVHAFEWGAFDYMLKPFECARVALALDRYRSRGGVGRPEQEIIARLETTESKGVLERFFVKERGLAVPVAVDTIEAIIAEGDYCRVHTTRSSHLIHLPLKEFERRLDTAHFRRVHRSAIVRLDCIIRIEPVGRGAYLQLAGGLKVTASRLGLAKLRPFTL